MYEKELPPFKISTGGDTLLLRLECKIERPIQEMGHAGPDGLLLQAC
jgi:hypothetical protein